jgi:hypothetical protein
MGLFVAGPNSVMADSNDKTTIVVLEGKALLVDVDDNGDVIRRYMEVPEYFESKKDHEEKVVAAKKKYEILKKHQIDQIRFIAFDNSFDKLDENAMKHLQDVALHYQQTYANQVIITAARRNSNAELLGKMISDVDFVLQSLGVAKEDIEVVYKNDKGNEPLQFVKVQSNLR